MLIEATRQELGHAEQRADHWLDQGPSLIPGPRWTAPREQGLAMEHRLQSAGFDANAIARPRGYGGVDVVVGGDRFLFDSPTKTDAAQVVNDLVRNYQRISANYYAKYQIELKGVVIDLSRTGVGQVDDDHSATPANIAREVETVAVSFLSRSSSSPPTSPCRPERRAQSSRTLGTSDPGALRKSPRWSPSYATRATLPPPTKTPFPGEAEKFYSDVVASEYRCPEPDADAVRRAARLVIRR